MADLIIDRADKQEKTKFNFDLQELQRYETQREVKISYVFVLFVSTLESNALGPEDYWSLNTQEDRVCFVHFKFPFCTVRL